MCLCSRQCAMESREGYMDALDGPADFPEALMKHCSCPDSGLESSTLTSRRLVMTYLTTWTLTIHLQIVSVLNGLRQYLGLSICSWICRIWLGSPLDGRGKASNGFGGKTSRKALITLWTSTTRQKEIIRCTNSVTSITLTPSLLSDCLIV